MKKQILTLLSLTLVFLITSCNSTRSIAKIERQSLYKDKNGNIESTFFTVHTDATQRISIVMAGKDGKFVTFSENPPDAAIESAMSIFAKAEIEGKKAGSVNAETKVEFAKTIAELGKRSEAINLQRDGMFRLSELYNNGGLTKTELKSLIDSLQTRTVRIVTINSNSEIENIKLKQLETLNKILSKADSTSTKPTSSDLIKLLSDF